MFGNKFVVLCAAKKKKKKKKKKLKDRLKIKLLYPKLILNRDFDLYQ